MRRVIEEFILAWSKWKTLREGLNTKKACVYSHFMAKGGGLPMDPEGRRGG